MGVTFVAADAPVTVHDRKTHAASKTDRPRFSFFIPCFPPLTLEKKYFPVLYIILANVNLEILLIQNKIKLLPHTRIALVIDIVNNYFYI